MSRTPTVRAGRWRSRSLTVPARATLQTYNIDVDFFAGAVGVSQSFDISSYVDADAQIRFRITQAAAGDQVLRRRCQDRLCRARRWWYHGLLLCHRHGQPDGDCGQRCAGAGRHGAHAQCGKRRRPDPGGGGGHAHRRSDRWHQRRGQRCGAGHCHHRGRRANGSWSYSPTTGRTGTNWVRRAGPARLLAADGNTRIYFQPNANVNGTIAAAITFRAWDHTTGSDGETANTASNGGTTAFSSATDTASLTVNAMDDHRPLAV